MNDKNVSNEKSAPLVSAVITAFNNDSTIGPAIDSFLHQNFNDREIIVVDDGSRDGTRREVEMFGDEVRLICQENGGSARARNTGLRNARGKYVAFLDGDDVALPDRLRRQVAALESHPSVGLVYGNVYLMDAQGQNVRLRWGTGRYKSGKVTRKLAIKNFVPFSTIMLRRQLLIAAGLFDEQIRSSEDWDMLVRLSQRCEFLYLHRPLVYYRVMPNSKTSNLDEKERAYKKVQSKIFAENDFGLDTQRLRRLSDASLQFGLLSISLRYGKFRRGLRYLIRGLAITPVILFHLWREIASRLLTPLFGSWSTSWRHGNR
jgi:glycosyltransferase involved in cell wall biosynthesis